MKAWVVTIRNDGRGRRLIGTVYVGVPAVYCARDGGPVVGGQRTFFRRAEVTYLDRPPRAGHYAELLRLLGGCVERFAEEIEAGAAKRGGDRLSTGRRKGKKTAKPHA